MKKILFIFVLSLYSIQGFAGSCPDGSEPVKSISADGTYFVYNCGSVSNKTSSSANSSSSNSSSSETQNKNFEVDKNTSHALQFRDVHVDIQALRQRNGKTRGYGASISYLDLDDDGDTDIFIAADSFSEGEGATQPVEAYLNNGSYEFTIDTDFFGENTARPETPRKSIIGDYNGDGKEDIYIADTGWDDHPFPGAPQILILSSATGYKTRVLHEFEGYQHGVASADIDSDGDLDIVGTLSRSYARSDAPGVFTLINDGTGNFKLRKLHSLPSNNYYTVELVDVDKDNYVDLLLGGAVHTASNARPVTQIFWGSETGEYTGWNTTLLPSVPGHIFAIDIDVGDIDNDGDMDLILYRTGSSEGAGDYKGYHIQILKNNGNRSFAQSGYLANKITPKLGGINRVGGWFMWLRLADLNNDGSLDILVDDAQRNLQWINSGSGSFSSLQEIKEEYKDGGKDGKLAINYVNGQKRFEEHYLDGKLNGKRSLWRVDGQILLDENYKDGKKHGTSSTWYANRQKKTEENYKDGLKHGEMLSWHENSNLSSKGNYQNGAQTGIETSWYENGKKSLEINYLNGKFDGKFTSWTNDGEIYKESYYKNGELINDSTEDSSSSKSEPVKLEKPAETKTDNSATQSEKITSDKPLKTKETPPKKTGIEAWADSSVCAWLKSSGGGHPTPLNEAKNRGISCN